LKEEEKPVVAAPSVATSVPLKSASLTFTGVQEKYIAEVKVADGWEPKTESENRAIYDLFVEAKGDLPVDQIDRAMMSDYKSSVLMCIPPNMKKVKQYAGMSIEEIIATKPEKTISPNTINKHIRRLSSLFNYAVKNGHISSNPASDMQIKNKKRADQEREAYITDDLDKLFNSKEYIEGKHRQPYCFWTPLIALYTGCRLEEICQLHLEDIRQDHGVWIFDINDKNEKKLKNRSSERLVPIHPQLINLGLIKFAAGLREKGHSRLFPELKQQRDGYGQIVSKWFGRYKTRCGIGAGKTFHSFRHTFITHLKHKQIDGAERVNENEAPLCVN
jgi:integrase